MQLNRRRFLAGISYTALQAIWSSVAAGEDVAPGAFRIVGYLPEYRIDTIDPAIAAKVTDIVVFSAETTEDGSIRPGRWRGEALRKVRGMKEKNGVRLLISVGGWGRSRNFPAVAASPDARKHFADELVRFCEENHFDGVDIDWEHPKGAREEADFGPLLTTLKKALAPKKLSLSIAAAGWQTLTPEVVKSVDFVHLMAYDGEGRHSTYEFAAGEVDRLIDKRGVPAEKICLGLPFYGRAVANRKESTYAQIWTKHHPRADADEVAGVYFNSPATIERKTRFARDRHLGGVMIWEIGQDVPGGSSLLEAIHRGMTP